MSWTGLPNSHGKSSPAAKEAHLGAQTLHLVEQVDQRFKPSHIDDMNGACTLDAPVGRLRCTARPVVATSSMRGVGLSGGWRASELAAGIWNKSNRSAHPTIRPPAL